MKLENLSEVAPWSPGSMPPPGVYTARIDKAEEGSSTNGFPQLQLAWTVIGGEYDGAECKEWMTIVPATRGKVVALLNAVGVEITPGEFELSAAALLGKTAKITLRKEPSYKDPSKLYTEVVAHAEADTAPVAAAAPAKAEKDIPFARKPTPDMEHGPQARRDLFVKGPEAF